jgi:hypothetical protein
MKRTLLSALLVLGFMLIGSGRADDNKKSSDGAPIQSATKVYPIGVAPVRTASVFEGMAWVILRRETLVVNGVPKTGEWQPVMSADAASPNITTETTQRVLNQLKAGSPEGDEWKAEKRKVRVLVGVGWKKYLTFLTEQADETLAPK